MKAKLADCSRRKNTRKIGVRGLASQIGLRILSEHQNTVIDFGAGHAVYDEQEQQEKNS